MRPVGLSLVPGSEIARCEKERFWSRDCRRSFRFLQRFSIGATAPKTSTTMTIGIQSQEVLLAAITGIAAAGAESVTVAEAVLSVAGSVAASATGVRDVSAGAGTISACAAAGLVDVADGLRLSAVSPVR